MVITIPYLVIYLINHAPNLPDLGLGFQTNNLEGHKFFFLCHMCEFVDKKHLDFQIIIPITCLYQPS